MNTYTSLYLANLHVGIQKYATHQKEAGIVDSLKGFGGSVMDKIDSHVPGQSDLASTILGAGGGAVGGGALGGAIGGIGGLVSDDVGADGQKKEDGRAMRGLKGLGKGVLLGGGIGGIAGGVGGALGGNKLIDKATDMYIDHATSDNLGMEELDQGMGKVDLNPFRGGNPISNIRETGGQISDNLGQFKDNLGSYGEGIKERSSLEGAKELSQKLNVGEMRELFKGRDDIPEVIRQMAEEDPERALELFKATGGGALEGAMEQSGANQIKDTLQQGGSAIADKVRGLFGGGPGTGGDDPSEFSGTPLYH